MRKLTDQGFTISIFTSGVGIAARKAPRNHMARVEEIEIIQEVLKKRWTAIRHSHRQPALLRIGAAWRSSISTPNKKAP